MARNTTTGIFSNVLSTMATVTNSGGPKHPGAVNISTINGSQEEMAVLPVPLVPTSPMTPESHSEYVPTTSSTWIHNSFKSDDSQSVALLLIPLLLMCSLALFSGIALYCVQRRKKLDRLRHRLIPMYSFAPGEEEEWGVLLNNDLPQNNR